MLKEGCKNRSFSAPPPGVGGGGVGVALPFFYRDPPCSLCISNSDILFFSLRGIFLVFFLFFVHS